MRVVIGLLGALLIGCGSAWPAWAHATVVATTPSNGAKVDVPIREVRVTFDEAVTLSGPDSTSVLDAAGHEVGDGSVRLVDGGRTLVFGLRSALPEGVYIASWSVVSADSHPIGGSIQFGYRVPASAIAQTASATPSAVLELLAGVAKALLYLSLIVGLGIVPAALIIGASPAETRLAWRVAVVGLVAGIVASLVQLAVQYLWQASGSPTGIGWADIRRYARSSFATAIVVRVGVLCALVALVSAARGRLGRHRGSTLLAALLGVAVLASVVHNGHGGIGSRWDFASTLIHVVAVVIWVGGLVALGWLVLRRRMSGDRVSGLIRWSWWAAACVGAIVATGVWQSMVQVRFPAALWGTAYGRLLLIKVALVVLVVGVAASSRRWVRRTRNGGEEITPGQSAVLRRRVQVETAIGAVIVLISGVLSSVVPAAAAYAPTRHVATTIGPYDVTVDIAPARRGPQDFRILVTGQNAAAPPPARVELALGRDDGSVRALPVEFTYRLPGALHPGEPTPVTFVSSAVNVPQTGDWTGTLNIVAGPTLQYLDTFTYRVE